MTAVRPSISVLVSFILILLLGGPALGQFKETYEPPGYLLQWGGEGSGDGQFSLPRGVAVDVAGNVYVADQSNHRIQKFDSAGDFIAKWGSQGSGNGQFDAPYGVAVDASGNVYVADTGNHRIQKFDSVGNSLTTWGSLGSGDGQFYAPYGVTADAAGRVYVADTLNHRIQKFDSAGNFLATWGSSGSGDGQFNYPQDVAADAAGNVYVADTLGHRIQKFDGDGRLLTKWGTYGFFSGQFYGPAGVAVDAADNVYVADRNNHRVQKFDSAGNFLATWGSSGSGDGQFSSPNAVAADSFGMVYVADTENHRIQKFAPALWLDVAGHSSYLSVATLQETTAVRTLFRLENNGAPRFAFKNTSSDIEWSFQQSGPGNFLISKEGTGGPEVQVYQGGRVRIGPAGAINFDLDPFGNLKIKGSLTANGSTFPDYVFEPDYNLMPLSDLRTYIQREKSLPDIPSADEVKKQGGHNMTELQLKLLEKIEELTLYTLELEEKVSRIEKFEAELAEIRTMLQDR